MRLVALLALGVVFVCAETPAELEKLLPTAAEPGIVMVEIARQYAVADDRKQALAWFEKAVALNPKYTPEFDRDFGTMAALPEFQTLVERARKASPPVRRGTLAFTVAESDLIPEGLAWDVRSKKLYLGSVNKHKIVEIASSGAVRDFIAAGQDGIGSVMGMKVDPRTNTLWANSLSNTEGSGVFHYDLATGRLIKKYVLPADLLFNDLEVTSKGDVFVTATRAQALYWISAETGKLQEWRSGLKLRDANGIAPRRAFLPESSARWRLEGRGTRTRQPAIRRPDHWSRRRRHVLLRRQQPARQLRRQGDRRSREAASHLDPQTGHISVTEGTGMHTQPKTNHR